MTALRLRSVALLVFFAGLALLSSTAVLGIFLFQGLFGFAGPPAPALLVSIILFLGGLTVAVFGAGVFLLRFAHGPPGETPKVRFAAGIALLIVGGGSILLALAPVVPVIRDLLHGPGVFEANFTAPLTFGGLLVLGVGILLLLIPKPAHASKGNPPHGGR